MAKGDPSLYKLLGLNRKSTQEEVEAAGQKILVPEDIHDKAAWKEHGYKQIAYKVLSNPETRALYDRNPFRFLSMEKAVPDIPTFPVLDAKTVFDQITAKKPSSSVTNLKSPFSRASLNSLFRKLKATIGFPGRDL
jgi:curved DNA-binding protein CbpA